MLVINGDLVDSKGHKYVDHKIVALFDEKVALEGENEGKKETVWKSSERRFDVSESGGFTLELLDREQMGELLQTKIIAPDGEILASKEYEVKDLRDGISINVDAKVFYTVPESDDPYLGKRVKITGRVLDAAGTQNISNQLVILWGRLKGSKANEFVVTLATRTDRQGYFSGDYPKEEYVEAYGTVSVNEGEKILISLENGRFPRNVILVVEIPDGVVIEEMDKVDMQSVPRAPDSDDLTNSPETYSTDLGGRCVTFTVPNRTFEEFGFHTVVRTTEPEIKGLTLTEPTSIPIDLIKRFFKSSMVTFRDSGAPDTFGTAVPTVMKSAALKTIAKTIDPNVLKRVATDPDNFTPIKLMTAGKLTNFNTALNIIDVIRKKVPGRGSLTVDNPVDWDDEPTFYQATTLAHGHILHFKQVWKADGYSLGDLLYSLPLAPCQKKQIAVIDWTRREIAARTERLEEEEQLAAMISRDRDIAEIVNSTLIENMQGGSESSTYGGGGGFSFFGLFSIGGGGGGASASSWQHSSRNVAASSLQQLRDRTMQSASAVRSQRSTVVRTVQQGEAMRVQTEVVANHNHCHAITIQFFEVLRHFQILQELVDVQECLFVPLLMSKFDMDKALRWRESLRRYLRDRSLRQAFDAVERILNNYEGSDLPTGRYSAETLEDLTGELHISFNIARPKDKDDQFDLDAWRFWVRLFGLNPEDIYNGFLRGQNLKDRIFQEQIAPRIAERVVQRLRFYALDKNNNRILLPIDPTLISRYRDNVPLYITLRLNDALPTLKREDITYIEIDVQTSLGGFPFIFELLPADSKMIVVDGSMRYRTKYMTNFLFRNSHVMNDLTGADSVRISTPLSREELRNPRQEDRELAKKLVTHLNEHVEHYHKAIWWTMDRDRRYMLLDGFVAPNANGRSVASVVENRLIGIAGNCLIMPVARGFHLDPTYRQDKDDAVDLLHLYAPNTPIPPVRVSVPTRGVFAESVMGSCNSCEEKDETRFWRFEESPCGDEPTLIQPVSTESRRAEPGDLKPQPFPAPMINLQNAPAAPDPTGLAAALRLLSIPNLFRDITGLEQTQKNAMTAMTSSLEAAKFFAEIASKVGKQQALAKDIGKTLQTIKGAQKDGLISEEQASGLTNSALKGMIGEDITTGKALTDEPEIKNLINSGSRDGSADVSVSRLGENVEVSRSQASGQSADGILSLLASLFGAGSPTPNSGSTKGSALSLVHEFRGWTGQGKFKLDRNDVADQLERLIDDENEVDQGRLNLCGPAAFFHILLHRDPLTFARYAVSLYEAGFGRIGSLQITPDDDLKSQTFKAEWACPSADWMTMSSLRDDQNWLWDFQGTPEETLSAATTPREITNWLKATGLYSRVSNEANYLLTKGLEHAKSLSPDANTDIVMLVHSHLIKEAELKTGRKKSDEFILSAFPNHMVVLQEPGVKEASNDEVEFTIWTWSDPVTTYRVKKDVFEANYYGAVIAEI